MAGGSVITLVQSRGAAGNKLDLGMTDGAIFVIEIPDLVVFHV